MARPAPAPRRLPRGRTCHPPPPPPASASRASPPHPRLPTDATRRTSRPRIVPPARRGGGGPSPTDAADRPTRPGTACLRNRLKFGTPGVVRASRRRPIVSPGRRDRFEHDGRLTLGVKIDRRRRHGVVAVDVGDEPRRLVPAAGESPPSPGRWSLAARLQPPRRRRRRRRHPRSPPPRPSRLHRGPEPRRSKNLRKNLRRAEQPPLRRRCPPQPRRLSSRRRHPPRHPLVTPSSPPSTAITTSPAPRRRPSPGSGIGAAGWRRSNGFEKLHRHRLDAAARENLRASCGPNGAGTPPPSLDGSGMRRCVHPASIPRIRWTPAAAQSRAMSSKDSSKSTGR